MAHDLFNMRLVSHNLLQGYPNIGEGMAIQVTSDNRRIMWLAHESAVDFTAVDVGGVVFSVSPAKVPRVIGNFDLTGPKSRGTHCLWCFDGHYAHLSTSMPDANPRDMHDDQFYVIVDVSDPAKPTEVGRWWVPGAMEGDEAPPLERHEPDSGYSAHNTNVYPQRPDRAYCGFKDGGVIILDISDMAHPKEVSRVDYHPPMPAPAFTHTALPLFESGLLIVTDESVRQDGEDWPKLTWVMDMSVETNPVTLSTLPLPPVAEMKKRPGRFGAHNIHENQPADTSFSSEKLIFGTYFNAGLRVHDVSNPFQPVEVAHFIPEYVEEEPAEKFSAAPLPGMNINDVYVDENELVYAVDRQRGGLYILEMTLSG